MKKTTVVNTILHHTAFQPLLHLVINSRIIRNFFETYFFILQSKGKEKPQPFQLK